MGASDRARDPRFIAPRFQHSIRENALSLGLGGAAKMLDRAYPVRPLLAAVSTLAVKSPEMGARGELQQLRWMVEEFRVSLYAQDLKTVMRVSEQRLAEQLERARAEASK